MYPLYEICIWSICKPWISSKSLNPQITWLNHHVPRSFIDYAPFSGLLMEAMAKYPHCARFPHIIAPISPMNMVLQREKHTVIKPFTTNYHETHPRRVDSLYIFITIGFYHGFTMVLPWFYHMFSMWKSPFYNVFHPSSSQTHLWGLLGLGLGLDPGRLSLVHRLVAGEPDRILRRLLEKGVEKMWKKCGKNVEKNVEKDVEKDVTTWVSGCCDCKPADFGEGYGKGDSTWLQNGGCVISVMPKMARIRQDLEIKSKQHRHLVFTQIISMENWYFRDFHKGVIKEKKLRVERGT